MGTTLAQKLWRSHLVSDGGTDRPSLIYIDLHLVQEISSPQAFEGLRLRGRRVRRPDLTIATEDHNVPTTDIDLPIADRLAREQVAALRANCRHFGIRIHSLNDPDQGIVHQIGPQLGLTQPGMTIACGDSHTSTHGAFGALAFGIGTSEVEHVLATQCLRLMPFKNMSVRVDGRLPRGVTSKDVIIALISKIGTGGAIGHVIEFSGEAVRSMSMEARMTLCNMSTEAGARSALIAPDETTFTYVKGRPHAPRDAQWDAALSCWRTLRSDDDAHFDAEVVLNAGEISPLVTWGTNPSQAVPVTGRVPDPSQYSDPTERAAAERALAYMDLKPGTPIRDIPVDVVFIGSCTNGRIEDLRAAAEVMRGRRKHPNVRVLVVPASSRVQLQAEAEGLHEVFAEFGAEWRNSGCSMCLGMNSDQPRPGERSLSTSNRNFEGRQGPGVRTHLASPLVAAATAVRGTIASPADLD